MNIIILFSRSTITILTTIACLVAATQPSFANTLTYQATIGLQSEYDNNSLQQPDKTHDISSTVIGEFNADGKTNLLDINANYNTSFTDYKDDTNEDNSELTGSGTLIFQLLDKRLYWLAEHRATRQIADRNNLDISDNRVKRQEFKTGPSVFFDITGVDNLEFSTIFSKIDVSESERSTNNLNTDSESILSSLIWTHRFNPITDIKTTYSYRDIETDENDDTTIQTFLVGFERTLRTLSYSISVGASRSEEAITNEVKDTNSSLSANAEIQKDTGSQTFLFTIDKRQLERSLSGLTDDEFQLINSSIASGSFSTSDVVDALTAAFSYENNLICRRCNYVLEYRLSDYDTDNANIADELNQLITTEFNYNLSRNLRASIRGTFETTDFSEPGGDYDDSRQSGELGLRWSLSNNLYLRFYGGYSERDREENEGFSDFDQGYGGFTINYNFLDSKLNTSD